MAGLVPYRSPSLYLLPPLWSLGRAHLLSPPALPSPRPRSGVVPATFLLLSPRGHGAAWQRPRRPGRLPSGCRLAPPHPLTGPHLLPPPAVGRVGPCQVWRAFQAL